MGLELHKKGQGTVARGTAYLLGASIIVYGAIRLYANLGGPLSRVLAEKLPLVGDVTIRKVVALVVGLGGLLGLHLLLNRPQSVDLMIDTEVEMRKVSWPSLPQVWNAALVVVLVTCVLAACMSVFDFGLRRILLLVF
jgi:preprotein translocase SecE subunit